MPIVAVTDVLNIHLCESTPQHIKITGTYGSWAAFDTNDHWEGEYLYDMIFCPFCGERLVTLDGKQATEEKERPGENGSAPIRSDIQIEDEACGSPDDDRSLQE